MRLDQIRIELQRRFEMGQRLFGTPARHQRVGEVVERAGQIRLERERIAIMGYGVVQSPEPGQDVG